MKYQEMRSKIEQIEKLQLRIDYLQSVDGRVICHQHSLPSALAAVISMACDKEKEKLINEIRKLEA